MDNQSHHKPCAFQHKNLTFSLMRTNIPFCP
nr:MAG TPA: hypothetical protein [Caudoviricetes sp.]